MLLKPKYVSEMVDINKNSPFSVLFFTQLVDFFGTFVAITVNYLLE